MCTHIYKDRNIKPQKEIKEKNIKFIHAWLDLGME